MAFSGPPVRNTDERGEGNLPLRLNLGCGKFPLDGYVNLDAQFGDQIYPLTLGPADEIRASHVLEHFGHGEAPIILRNWVSRLKDGGILKIAVPCFYTLLKMSKEHRIINENLEFFIMGGQIDGNDYHKSLWNGKKLHTLMEMAGLSNITTWTSEIQDCASYQFSLNLQGVKRG